MTQSQILHAKLRGLYKRENFILSQISLRESVGFPADEYKIKLIGIQHQLQACTIDYIIAIETEREELK